MDTPETKTAGRNKRYQLRVRVGRRVFNTWKGQSRGVELALLLSERLACDGGARLLAALEDARRLYDADKNLGTYQSSVNKALERFTQ